MSSTKANGPEDPLITIICPISGPSQKEAFCVRQSSRLRECGRRSQAPVRIYWSLARAPEAYRDSAGHRYYARMLEPALGRNREYFHPQTLGDSDRLEAGGARDFL